MQCPNCNAQNADSYKFCQKCGAKLPVVTLPPKPVINPVQASSPANPLAEAAQICFIGSAISGALIILGWFTPWFGLMGLGNLFGSGLFSSYAGIVGKLTGVGNGLQLTLAALTATFAALGFDAGGLAFIALLIAGFFIAVIVTGIVNIRSAIALYEARPKSPSENADKRFAIRVHIEALRGRSLALLTIMVILFVVAAAVPFATAVLGGGFYLTLLGSVCGYASAILGQKRMPIEQVKPSSSWVD